MTVLAGLALVAAGCGDPGSNIGAATVFESTSAPQDGNAREVAADTTSTNVGLYELLPVEAVIYAAPTVVVSTVAGVAGPFWNAADGQKWAMSDKPVADGGDYTVPVLYREITLQVDEVLRDDHKLATESTIVVYALGAGNETDDLDAFVGGHYAEGEQLLLFLVNDVFYMREGPIEALQPFSHSVGVFHLEEEYAVPDARRVAELEAKDTSELAAIADAISLFEASALMLAVEERELSDKSDWELIRPGLTDAADLIRLIQRDIGSQEAEAGK